MDFLYLIRLFKRNIILLIGVPILLVFVVYYFTRNREKVYQSESVIYTGITTGYSIESATQTTSNFFTTNAQFDNMINLLKSRETVVETSIILLAQDLSLEHYNPQYISNANYDRLQKMIPKRIKDLVVKNNKSGIEREKAEQIRKLRNEIHSLEKRIRKKRNQATKESSSSTGYDPAGRSNTSNYGMNKNNTTANSSGNNNFITHTVLPGESISSIASRYGISRGELIQLNHLGTGGISSGQKLIIKRPPSSVSNTVFIVVQPGETLYSIAKRYGVTIDKLIKLNNLSTNTVIPGQKIVISKGVQANNGLYDYTTNKVSQGYVANGGTVQRNAITGGSSAPTAIDSTQKGSTGIFVKDPIVPPGINKSDFSKTVNNLRKYYASDDTNFIYGLLHYGQNPHYSINYINKIQIFRISNSDLVKLTFTSSDPGICQQTLKIISKVFMKDYKLLRVNETDRVVQYFQHQVDSADRNLSDAEDRLLRFNKRNNIINYYEQSKAIALQKEALDKYYQDQQIKLSGASLTLQKLATKMTERDSIYLKSDEINQTKKQLASISERIIVNRLAQNYNSAVAARLKVLTKQQQKLRDNIKFYVDQLYLYGHSTQGVSIKNLLDAWLTNTIQYTEAKAALIVLARRKLDFIRTYQKMAPLGAMLTRIQREIKVAEQTYLELLRSLNLAKMKQQNLEMSTNIKVVDPPYFPIAPNASKAKYIILASGLAGFILIGFIIIMLEYYDTTTKNPSRVVEQTGMQLAGAYPYLSSRNFANELSQISNRLIDMIIQNIKLTLANAKPQPEKPYLILVFSTQNAVGKSLISRKVINRMRSMGNKVLFLNYTAEDNEIEDEDFNHSYHYIVKNNFIDVENLQQLVDSRYLRKNNVPYDYIFLEIPSIIYHTYPIKLLSEIDLALFFIKSSNSYSSADKMAIKSFREAAAKESLVVLNEVELFNLGELVTDIPKTKAGWLDKLKATFSSAAKYKIVIKKEAKNRG